MQMYKIGNNVYSSMTQKNQKTENKKKLPSRVLKFNNSLVGILNSWENLLLFYEELCPFPIGRVVISTSTLPVQKNWCEADKRCVSHYCSFHNQFILLSSMRG